MTTKFEWMPDFVKSVKKSGFTILCFSNGKTLRTFRCRKCKKRKLVILLKEGKREFRACPCGHREAYKA